MQMKSKADYRARRHRRLRQRVHGTAQRPRLCVFLSGRRTYVQFIDDDSGRTLASASTLGGELNENKNTVATAKKLGELAARRAKAAGIQTVVFDRGGFAYGGRMRALADAAREAGLKF